MADEQVFTMGRFFAKAEGFGPGRGINIIPVSDVHFSSPSCDRERYLRFVRRCREEDGPNTYYLFGGDEDDLASGSERLILGNPALHDATQATLDDVAERQVRDHADMWTFAKGRILGVMQGNHHWVFQSERRQRRRKTDVKRTRKAGQTSTELFAELVGAQWLGWLTYLVVSVRVGNSCHGAVHIVAAHGRAGGKLVGSSINQVADMRELFPNADVYLMGHDHQRGTWPIEHLAVSAYKGGLHLRHRKQILGRMGSFLRSYVPGERGYIVRSLRRPANLGTVKLMASWSRGSGRQGDSLEMDLHTVV